MNFDGRGSHSAGGYSAVHAMLQHPETFKVGVATAGSHDFIFSSIP